MDPSTDPPTEPSVVGDTHTEIMAPPVSPPPRRRHRRYRNMAVPADMVRLIDPVDETSTRVFRSGEKVGQGSFSSCYEAFDTITNDKVCLKVTDLCHDKVDAIDIRNEMMYLKQFQHINVLPLHGYHVGIDLVVTMAIEFCPFSLEDIRVACDEEETVRTRLHHKLARKCVRQIASGLEYLHAHRVVHCDVKPDNIMCTPDGVLKLADFGLAMTLEQGDMVTDGISRGTTEYMSPEMKHSEPYNTSADIWALTVVLYELTFGVICRPMRPSYQRRFDEAVIKSGIDKSTVKRSDGTSVRASRQLEKLFRSVFVEDVTLRPTATQFKANALFRYDDADCYRSLMEEIKLVKKLKLAKARAQQEYTRTGALKDLDLETSSDDSDDSDESSDSSSEDEHHHH